MFGTQVYINQQFDREKHEPWYSEILYQNSVVSGADCVATIDYGDFGAKYIYISGIIISFFSTLGSNTSFTDQFGRVLFTVKTDTNTNGYIEFEQVIKGSTLFVSAHSPAAGFTFTVKHQYLREVDLPKKK